MKRIAILVMVVGLVFGSVATAEAGKKKKAPPTPEKVELVIEGNYTCPCGIKVAERGVGFILGSGEGGFSLATSSDSKFVSLELTDASGQPVYFELAQDLDGDAANVAETDVGAGCGKTAAPLEIPAPGSEVVVFAFSGTCGMEPTPSVATGGAFKAVLSNMP